MQAEVIEQKDYGNHVKLTINKSANRKPILILAHYDTVWPAGSLRRLPFRIEDGKAYGPGIFDMKCGLVQGLWALRALLESGNLNSSIVVISNSDEEIGSPSSRAIIEGEAKKAECALVLEPSQDGNLKTARKGTGEFKIRVKGKPAHADLDPERGVSAIEELCRLVIELHSMTNFQTGTTLNVGVIRGGTRPNVIAEEAYAELDLRVMSKNAASRMIPEIMSLRPHNPKVSATVEGGMNRPPMERTKRTEQLFLLAKRLALELGYGIGECSVGGASDGNFCSALGIPVLDGLGAVGDGAHAAHEHIVVDTIPLRAALVSKLIETI